MKRQEINEKYKWNTEEIFESEADFYAAVKECESALDFKEFKGKLNTVENVKRCYNKLYACDLKLEVIAVYAMMKKDENGEDRKGIEFDAAADNLFLKFSSETSFIDPEITALDDDTLNKFVNSEELAPYKRDLKRLIEFKPHILSAESEKLLALGGKVFGGYRNVFSMINNVDLDCPTIKADGKDVKVTSATFSVLLQNPDKKVREEAFKAYYGAFRKVLNTITEVYHGNVEKDVFLSRARKFGSCIDSALFSEEVYKKVYLQLLESVNEALPLVHKYVNLRKKIMGGEIHMYDMYVPLVKGAELALDYEDAFGVVLEGLAPLGEDYLNTLRRAHDERWIDVYENDGKRGGAYSVCVYGLKHPYVLLNHTKTTHALFTIAHELGHAMHSYKSDAAQPQQTADYKIFVAEVASTVNEILLCKYLIKNAKDRDTKKYLLTYYMDTIRTTLFRQTMFAEFEYFAHDLIENGGAASKEAFNEKYLSLNKKYYGDGVIHDDEISFEWARIPHFYTAFYVYKYATGIISAIAIAERILSGTPDAVEDYFKFLSSGSSDTPVNLLKITGVDLTEKAAYDLAMKSFENALSEFEKLL